MAHLKLPNVIMLILLALLPSACSQQKAFQSATSAPSTVILTPRPTATQPPLPTLTPKPAIQQSMPEVVADDAATGDGGNSWGGHQTRIVHTWDGIFTAYTVAGGGYLKREWRLAQRQSDGTWTVVAQGSSGREPVNLLASPDGTLHVVGWPDGIATLWSGKPHKGVLEMSSTRIPNQLNGNWPYNSAGIDATGDICVLSSDGGEEPVGWFRWACLMAANGKWVTGTNKLDFRFCYTYVFPGSDGQLSLVSTRDVRWQALGYQQPPGSFDYVFNAFGFWQTDNIKTAAWDRVYFAEEKPTDQYPAPILNAQEDAYLDTGGRMHVIYHIQGASTQGAWISHQAVISTSGTVLEDAALPDGAGDYSRIFQDNKGRFFLLGSTGFLYPMDQDGIHAGSPISINLGGYEIEYSGFGLSVPRTGTPLSDVIDVVFPSAGGSKWLYLQVDLSAL